MSALSLAEHFSVMAKYPNVKHSNFFIDKIIDNHFQKKLLQLLSEREELGELSQMEKKLTEEKVDKMLDEKELSKLKAKKIHAALKQSQTNCVRKFKRKRDRSSLRKECLISNAIIYIKPT